MTQESLLLALLQQQKNKHTADDEIGKLISDFIVFTTNAVSNLNKEVTGLKQRIAELEKNANVVRSETKTKPE